MTNIVLLGPPGCGKGTQSKNIVDKRNFLQLSTGDLLRKTVKSGSKTGQKIKLIMEKGELVPDDLVIDMIINSIEKNPKRNFIFDGFPRNLNQAVALDQSLKKNDMELNHVIFLNVELNVLEERIKKRVLESDSARTDDNVETLMQRVKIYKKSTFPLLEYYRSQKKLNEIEGMQSIQNVYNQISKVIDNED